MPVVGIDVAKLTFEAAIWIGGRWKTLSFANSSEGISKLQRLLGEQHHVCLEATGRYGATLAKSLHEAGHTVSVVNPMRIQRYAESRLRRTKTDRADAILIAEFCDKEQPRAWKPLPPETEELRELIRRREHVLQMQQMERNRHLAGPVSPAVETSIERSLAFWKAELELIEQAIEAQIQSHETVKRQRDLLETIPGLGRISAAILLAEIGDIHDFPTAKNLVAFAGLSPRERSSGTSVRGHAGIAKMGNPRIRRVLYMSALSAKRFNPPLRDFANRLAGSKPKKVIQVAVMRKLLHQVHAVLTYQQPFKAEPRARSMAGEETAVD